MPGIKIELSGIDSTVERIEKSYQEFVERAADIMVEELKAVTPVQTGRAQAGWRREKSGVNSEIVNPVPYVGYLERPYVRSKKAPKGMIGPALTATKGRLR